MGRPARRQHVALNLDGSWIPGVVWRDRVEARSEDEAGYCDRNHVVVECDVAKPVMLFKRDTCHSNTYSTVQYSPR